MGYEYKIGRESDLGCSLTEQLNTLLRKRVNE